MVILVENREGMCKRHCQEGVLMCEQVYDYIYVYILLIAYLNTSHKEDEPNPSIDTLLRATCLEEEGSHKD